MDILRNKYDEEVACDGSSEYLDNSNESMNESFLQKIMKKQHSQIQKALKDNIENNIEQLNKYAICNIVMSKLFPRIKF